MVDGRLISYHGISSTKHVWTLTQRYPKSATENSFAVAVLVQTTITAGFIKIT